MAVCAAVGQSRSIPCPEAQLEKRSYLMLAMHTPKKFSFIVYCLTRYSLWNTIAHFKKDLTGLK